MEKLPKPIIGVTVLIFFFPLFAWAAAVHSPSMMENEFLAIAKIRRLTPLTESPHVLLRLHDREELKASYLRAQKAFLDVDLEETRKRWLDVVNFAFKADWDESSRQMIMNAYMRLAQSSMAPGATAFLREAAAFDEKYVPDPTLFPPPLIRQFEEAVKQIDLVEIPAEAWTPFKVALVNGRRHILDENLNLPRGMVRVTLISNDYLPVSRIAESKDLKRFRPVARPMVSGSCGAYQLNARELSDVVTIAAPLSCESKKVAIGLARRNPEPDFRSQWKAPSGPPLFRNPYFWIGAGIIAGLVIHNNRDRDNGGPPPTVKDGF